MSASLKSSVIELIMLSRQGRQATLSGKLTPFLIAFEDQLAVLSPDLQHTLMAPIPKLLKLQEQGDWVGFADVLEYDLLTHL